MPCYHPVPAFRTPHGVVFSALARHDILGSIEIPCGQCIGCRLRRSHDWAVRIMHEASLWEQNCFVTLTYGRDMEPPGRSLHYPDFQVFMKRMRKAFKRPGIRFFMSGEYGPLNLRPHYHACLFNVDFDDKKPGGKSASGNVFYRSELLAKLWRHGHVSVQALTKQSAAYTARYCVDKVTGDDAEAHYCGRVPEFCRCSLRPGIGAGWFERFGSDVYPRDFVVSDGREFPPPKYYDRLLKRSDKAVSFDQIELSRTRRALSAVADNTPERLAVREIVQKARVSNLKRSFEDG